MTAKPHTPAAPSGSRSLPVMLLAGVYAVVWIATAIAPFDRFDWFLENLLVFALVGALLATYRQFQFSTTSYVMILTFLCIHAYGAHYTYSRMPVGFLIQDLFGLARNHYDRVAHFAFGLLFAYPAHELTARTTRLCRFGAGVAAFLLILAVSSGYELVEWWVALVVSPQAADAYLGTQGDIFDAQKDTTCAIAGAALTLAAVAILPCATRRAAPEREPA